MKHPGGIPVCHSVFIDAAARGHQRDRHNYYYSSVSCVCSLASGRLISSTPGTQRLFTFDGTDTAFFEGFFFTDFTAYFYCTICNF